MQEHPDSCNKHVQAARALPNKPGQHSLNSFPLTILDVPYERGVRGQPWKGPPRPPRPSPPKATALPSPPLHFCFIYEYVARIPMSYLFCGPVNFPTEALSPADSEVSRNSEKEKTRAKNSFQLFFFRFRSFLSLPAPASSRSFTPFSVTRSLKLKPGGSYRDA